MDIAIAVFFPRFFFLLLPKLSFSFHYLTNKSHRFGSLTESAI
jgi:hypothetical protein